MSKNHKKGKEQGKKAPLRGAPYWQDQLDRLLREFDAAGLPDSGMVYEKTGRNDFVAMSLRRKYVVRRLRHLKKTLEEPQLSEQGQDFLDQARLHTSPAYWRDLDHEYHARGVFML